MCRGAADKIIMRLYTNHQHAAHTVHRAVADSYLIVQKLHGVHLQLMLFSSHPLRERERQAESFISVQFHRDHFVFQTRR